jgi:hypothetical protein
MASASEPAPRLVITRRVQPNSHLFWAASTFCPFHEREQEPPTSPVALFRTAATDNPVISVRKRYSSIEPGIRLPEPEAVTKARIIATTDARCTLHRQYGASPRTGRKLDRNASQINGHPLLTEHNVIF